MVILSPFARRETRRIARPVSRAGLSRLLFDDDGGIRDHLVEYVGRGDIRAFGTPRGNLSRQFVATPHDRGVDGGNNRVDFGRGSAVYQDAVFNRAFSDLNPVIVNEKEAVVVDARIRMGNSS